MATRLMMTREMLSEVATSRAKDQSHAGPKEVYERANLRYMSMSPTGEDHVLPN